MRLKDQSKLIGMMPRKSGEWRKDTRHTQDTHKTHTQTHTYKHTHSNTQETVKGKVKK